MRYRLFGETGIFISEIGLGTMTFSGKGRWAPIGALTPSEAETLVGTAIDAGVNFIDTADVYAEGESEKYLGAALVSLKRPRESLIIATKVRGRTGPGPNDVGLSRKHILSSIDESLKRLKLDYVDLYQIHGVDLNTPIEETVRALDTVVRSGKARYVGYCNLPAWLAMKALAYADSSNLMRFVSAQMYYTATNRDIEREVVPLAKDQHLAILPWSPLAGGLLTGKFDMDKPGPKGARRTSYDFPPVEHDRGKRVLSALRFVADESGVSVARVAIAWLLSHSYVTSIITGAKTKEQLLDNLGSSDVRLAADHVNLINAASELPPEYPGWMVERLDHDRRSWELPAPVKKAA